jgi:hypothetical protein
MNQPFFDRTSEESGPAKLSPDLLSRRSIANFLAPTGKLPQTLHLQHPKNRTRRVIGVSTGRS